jgi:hypothetical protein
VLTRPLTGRDRTVAAFGALALFAAILVPSTPAPASANGCPSASTGGSYGGGNGTAETPFLIASTAHLLELSVTSTDWGKHFLQTANIDLEDCDWTPIGSDVDNQFTGTYDGATRTISNLHYSDPGIPYAAGLFGRVDTGARITDVVLEDVAVYGVKYVGGLVSFNQGTIIRSGVISGEVGGLSIDAGVGGVINAEAVGGLVGVSQSGGVVRESFVGPGVKVVASGMDAGIADSIGGLVGRNNASVRTSSAAATLDVEKAEGVGGLVGKHTGGLIEHSSATGPVGTVDVDGNGAANAKDTTQVGGLVGRASAPVSNSYATGDVTVGTGSSRIGGLIGYGLGNGNVTNSYAIGAVTGATPAGRLIGEYDEGTLLASTALASGGAQLIGTQGGTATVTNSELRDVGALTTFATFRDTLGWAILSGSGAFAPPTAIWGICADANGGYPFLLWQDHLGAECGDGNDGDDDGNTGGGGGGSSGASTPVLVGGTAPTLPAGQAVWQQTDGTQTPLDGTSSGVGQLTYSAPGVSVTLTGAPGTSVTNGVVAPSDGTIDCEVCTTLPPGGVIEAWMFSTPRLVAAHRIDDLPCQRFPIFLGAPLDGGGPVSTGAHTLQLALPTASGMQAINVGVTVGGLVPASVPAGEGSVPMPLALLLAALVSVGGAVLVGRRALAIR